jgi:hypothetical protein
MPASVRSREGKHLMADESGQDTGLWTMADLVTPMVVRVAATLRIAATSRWTYQLAGCPRFPRTASQAISGA